MVLEAPGGLDPPMESHSTPTPLMHSTNQTIYCNTVHLLKYCCCTGVPLLLNIALKQLLLVSWPHLFGCVPEEACSENKIFIPHLLSVQAEIDLFLPETQNTTNVNS